MRELIGCPRCIRFRAVVGDANALLRQRKYDEAIAKYDETLRLKPDDYGPMNARGICWENKGDLDRALADFNGVLQIKPTFVLALWNRGRIYQKKGGFYSPFSLHPLS